VKDILAKIADWFKSINIKTALMALVSLVLSVLSIAIKGLARFLDRFRRWLLATRQQISAPPSPERRTFLLRRVASVGVVLLVALAALAWQVSEPYRNHSKNIEPVGPGISVVLTIPSGSTTVQIGNLLAEHGLIRDSAAFAREVKRQGVSTALQAGTYDLAPTMTVPDIIDKLVQGAVVNLNIRVTIPEGLTLIKTAELFERRGLFTAEEFMSAVDSIELDYDYIALIPEGGEHRLEGYLFPDTYEVPAIVSPGHIIRLMAARFNQLIPPRYAESLKNEQYTLHEVVTMASIVEKEAVKRDERARIAGVFYNRIENPFYDGIGGFLQSCASIQYILGEPRALLYVDLEIEHPYNTYLNPGLPPGPISGSGLLSFEAAMGPESHDLYYFVARSDGSHIFSKTFAEHQRAIQVANSGN
jgi:UPF0755 protein